MSSFELKHLKALLAVAEQGSFNRAAAALQTGQPAISKSIALLERAARVPLFERGPRGAVLTPAGEILTRTAAAMVHLIEDAVEDIEALAQGGAGRLIVGATPSTTMGLVPLACSRLGSRIRNAELIIREGLDTDLLPALERGEIDLLVGPVADLQALPQHLVEATLFEEGLSIGVRPGHPLAKRESVTLGELVEAAWIMPVAGSKFHQLVEAMFLASALPWPTNIITTNSLAAQEIIALDSDRLLLTTGIQYVARSSALAVIPVQGSPRRRIGWRRLKKLRPSPLLDAFIEELGAVIACTASQSVTTGPTSGMAD